MSYCDVGGWVGGLEEKKTFIQAEEEGQRSSSLLGWVGGWVGGWVECSFYLLFFPSFSLLLPLITQQLDLQMQTRVGSLGDISRNLHHRIGFVLTRINHHNSEGGGIQA